MPVPAEPQTTPPPPMRRRRARTAAVWCVLIAVAFGVHAWLASRDKSATFDEPVHTVSAWLIVNRGDFRVNPEHPPLWKYLAGLPLRGFPLSVDLNSPASTGILQILERQWMWTADTLYRTSGNDGVALVARARMAMAVLPCLLALVVARWAWSLAGPVAGVVAALLLSLDPNLLAHGALVTNDVAATLVFALAALLTWRLGQGFTWTRAIGWTLVAALGVGVKFTCVLLAPILAVLLLARAVAPRWLGGNDGREAEGAGERARGETVDVPERAAEPRAGSRAARLFARLGRVVALGAAASLLAVGGLWAMYQFRCGPTPDGRWFDAGYARRLDAYYSLARAATAGGGTMPPRDQLLAKVPGYRPPLSMRALYAAQDHGLIPQTLGIGLTYAHGRSQARPTFFRGELATTGTPLYFPMAMAWKTPLAAMAIALLAAAAGGPALVRALRTRPSTRWAALCLVLPPAVYMASAMGAGLNIGVRHVLPVLPPLYVAIGVAAAHAARRWRAAIPVVGVGAVALAVEVLSVFPNYLPFFNLAAGGTRGGLGLLADSNLDWGQDLPALADWYREWRPQHPRETFFLAYFGSVDPHAYGIDYVNAAPGYPLDHAPPTDELARPGGGVLAVSATALQGTYDPQSRDLMAAIRASPPLDVINGTIYLYALPDAPARTGGRPTRAAPDPSDWSLPR